MTLTWNFGDAVVTTSPARDHVQRDGGERQQQRGRVVLNNTATLDHRDAAGVAQPPLNAADDVTVIKPKLALVKTASPTTYDSVADGISYSYLLTNNDTVTLMGRSR